MTATWHIITGEYPPDVGGVADYTATVAGALAVAGDDVHVWTSGAGGTSTGSVSVHRSLGRFRWADLVKADRIFDARSNGTRVLVQWVPHAYGRRGVNLQFPVWLYRRSARRRAPVDVMIHEPFLPFAGSARHHAAALVQRAMTATVLRSASRVFVGTPAWAAMCRPLAPHVSYQWTPIPSGVPAVATPEDGAAYRREMHLAAGDPLIGCFGRAGACQEQVLDCLARMVRQAGRRARILLIGLGSDATVRRIVGSHPELADTLIATGAMHLDRVSAALRACDVMIQPYGDGICARHSSAMAVLAHGLPVVANEGRFTEPLWRQSGAVKLLATAEPPVLASAALQLLDDSLERRRLSKAALDLYDAEFDVRHTVAALRA